MTGPRELWLEPARWVPLPGTELEVMLHGKHRTGAGPAAVVTRTGDTTGRSGGWDLRPLAGRAYIRQARQ